MFDLSVIIPIYNTPEDALQRSFDSVATLRDIRCEVLLIDDGSQPSTGSFCQNYASQHENFRYFYQNNAGVSAARNTGIRNAQGRYLTFLDADDTLLGAAISTDILHMHHSLIIYDLCLQEGSRQNVWHALRTPTGPVTQEQLLEQLIISKSLNSPCGKLFARSVIAEHSLLFDTGFVTGEDWNFVCDFVLHIPQAYYCGTPAYRYDRSGGTSLSRTKRFPDTMLSNALQMLQRKQALILLPSFAEASNTLTGIAAATYLEELFNTAADLLLLKQMTRQRKVFIQEKAHYAAALLQARSFKKAWAKALVLRRFWFVLRPLACLRKLYLKLKH